MGDQRLLKRIMSKELENVEKHAPGGREGMTDCGTEGHRVFFGIMGNWSTAALNPGVGYSTVCEGGCRFMAAWVKKEENASETRQRKRGRKRRTRLRLYVG